MHAVCDGEGQPLILLLSEGQMSDHKGARLMVDALPTAFSLLGDKAMTAIGSAKPSPTRASNHAFRRPKVSTADRLRQARQRHKIENVFGKLKDWRPIATRYDRGAHTFFSAICIAATVIFWL